MTKNKIYKDYDEFLQDRLKDPRLAVAYLNQAFQDEDENVFLIALKDVLSAQGVDISALAKKAHLNRQNLYKMLSKDGNPRWSNITSLMAAMGLKVRFSYE